MLLLGAFTLTIITMMAYEDVVRLTSVFVETCEVSYNSIIAVIGMDALVIFDFLAIISLGGWFLVIGHNQYGRLTKEDWQRF